MPVTPILLVEDDDADAAFIQDCLAESGVQAVDVVRVRTIDDVAAALERRPRCALLGLRLPETDGYGAVRELVDAVAEIPVIVVTGRPDHDGVEVLTAGAQDYLTKDTLTAELLGRSIRYAIERKRTQRAQEQLREVRMSATEKARLERGLLPTPRLHSGRVSCATYYQPGRENAVLGGDFFDVVEVSDGRIRAIIGDVMGHGPDEAALGVHLRVAWRTLLLAGTPDEEMLPLLARLLETEQDAHRRYVTLCDITLDAETTTLRLAGHPAPILCADGGCAYPDLEVGPPLGVQGSVDDPDRIWPVNHIDTPAGTSLLLFTDGLLDAYSVDLSTDSIGIAELIDAVQKCLCEGGAPTAWITRVVSGAPSVSADDIAVVALSVHPS